MTKEERAAYMRGYRKTVEPLKEREAREDGFRAAIEACKKIAQSEGYYGLAKRFDRLTNTDSPELLARRAFLKSLQPAG